METLKDVPCDVIILAKINLLGDEIARVKFKDNIDVFDYGWYDDTGHETDYDESKFYDTLYVNQRLKDKPVKVECIRASGNFNTKSKVKVKEIFSVHIENMEI